MKAFRRKDGLLWILFPKNNNNQQVIEQNLIVEHLKSLKYQKIRSISLDQEVSALKFKHRTHIKRLSIKGSMRVSDMMGGHYGK
jgi:serine protease inhibitor